IELVKDYKIEMGAGIKRSFGQLFIGVSACFTMIYILGAVINWYFLQTTVGPAVWKGLILIELLAYGIVFLLQIKFTFLPPIIVTGLVFLFLAGTYFIYNWP
ncbi:MAG: LIC_13387 family protein, partial [Chitinophagaceae bacterium]